MTQPRILRRPWTEPERALLRQRYATTLTQTLADALGRTRCAVAQEAGKLGLHKAKAWVAENARQSMANPAHGGRRAQFKPGNVPWTAGTKGTGLAGKHPNTQAHQFRPGNISGHAAERVLPLGSYRINTDGVCDQKISTRPGAQNHRWRAVHRLVWEAAHGPVPAGHAVAFKPGRRTSDPALITLDALELVTKSDVMRRNSLHNLPPELAGLVQLRGVLTRAINTQAKKGTE